MTVPTGTSRPLPLFRNRAAAAAVQVREQQLDQVRLAEAGPGEDEGAAAHQVQDVEPRQDRRIADLEPFVVADPGVLACVDEFTEGEESEFHRMRAIGGGARDMPEQFAGQESDL